MDGFNFRRLLLSTSFWFLLSFEIHCSQKFYEGLRVETELSVLSLQREKKPFRLRSSSEPLRISQKRNLLASLGMFSRYFFSTQERLRHFDSSFTSFPSFIQIIIIPKPLITLFSLSFYRLQQPPAAKGRLIAIWMQAEALTCY